MKQEGQFAAFIGIDWADQKHDVCLRTADSDVLERAVVAHTPEELERWAESLRQRFGGKPVAVCLEMARGPLVSALVKHRHLVVFPVNPLALSKYREAWHPSGAKDDPTDAELALEVLVKHRDKLGELRLQSPAMRALQRLVEDRRRLVEDRVRLTNRIVAALKEYFPQVLDWFEDRGTVTFCDFVERWPSAEQAKRARSETLKAFFHEHNVRNAQRIEERIAAIKSATALTTDPGAVTPAKLLVLSLVPALRAMLQGIKQYDDAIAEQCSKLSDYRIFASFPAAAEVFAPRLLAAFGEDRSRFKSAQAMQCYGGVAPVTERSGNQQWVHWRFCSTTFVRQTLVEWAAQTIPHSYWAGEFYKRHRERGGTHQGALRALAFKWVRILYRCWVNKTPYDESRYLKHLRARNAPLLTAN
ncbi:MAG TPA: IS110 family transposase [Polyangiaceae bacterium]|nr:IS110 family transposase [Polyangiaceae bacterium]